MTLVTPDNRKSNALIFLGVLLLCLTYFTLTSDNAATQKVWTIFLVLAGLLFVSLGLLTRYIIYLTAATVIIKNRLGIFSKTIYRSDIAKVKVTEKDYPVSMYRNTLLHLLLWDKKFSRFKQVQLLDAFGNTLFTIDGQAIDNAAYSKLVKALKR